MSLKKTDTIALDNEIWAKLVPLSTIHPMPTYELKDDQILIGRGIDCNIVINDKRLSAKHCKISKKGDHVEVQDLSTNGTFVGQKKIGKGKIEPLSHGNQLFLLPVSKVQISETIGFRVELTKVKIELEEKEKEKSEEQLKIKEEQMKAEAKKKQEQDKRKEEEEKKRVESTKAANSLAQSIKDQITCAFCCQIMSIPVSVQPCNHRYCGGCLSELVEKKKDTCIQCRKQITTVVRDAAFSSIIDDYLKSHPEEKRDPKDQEELKAKNIFSFDPINVREKIHGKPIEKPKAKVERVAPRGRGRRSGLVRASSDLSASDDDEKDKCRQCLVSRNGFQCGSTQVHIGCHSCGKLIAQRDDPSLNQNCAICTTFFCNLYFPPCSKTGAKLSLLKDRRQTCKIDPELMRGNTFEFEAIRNYLMSKKINSKDLFDYVLEQADKKKFSYLMDKKIMKVAPLVPKQIKLDRDSAVCDLCWKDLWFQMVFHYRMQMSADFPSSVRDRPVCYWGINCRTMDHNQDHSRKYNHCIYQTRFG